MRKITIVLLSSLLIIALGACKNATPQVENAKPALMWFDAVSYTHLTLPTNSLV